jgi:hypothetical protein
MPQRATQPIQFPDHERVAWPQLVENLTERWTVIERTAGSVDEDAITADRFEGVVLQVRVLVCCGHTGVPKQVRHWAAAESYQKRPKQHVLRR